MTAISVSFSPKVATDWDPQKPLTTTKLNQLYDNTEFVKQWLGQSYVGGAVQNHSHNGLDSALIPVGANELRNGSFEADTTGWTVTQYTGGSVAVNTANNLNGATALAFTSTVLLNGGGDALSNEFVPVTGGSSHSINAVAKAGAANLSGKIEIHWYDNTQALISTSVVYTSNNLPIALSQVGGSAIAPSTARFKRIRVTGHIVGSVGPVTTGTVYFDGVISSAGNNAVGIGLNFFHAPIVATPAYTTNATAVSTKKIEWRVGRDGRYTVRVSLYISGTVSANAQIYKNGVAYGTLRTTTSLTAVVFDEELNFSTGDLIQIYTYSSSGGFTTYCYGLVGELFPPIMAQTL